MQPNPGPNNKAAQNIEAPTTFHTYLITPIGLNEIELRLGKVIKPNHSPINIEEECESSREDTIDLEVVVTPITTNAGQTITPVTTNLRRTVAPVTSKLSKADTPVTTNSTVMT